MKSMAAATFMHEMCF